MVRGSFSVLFSTAYNALTSYALIILLARTTDVETFGHYSVALALLVWVEIITAQPFRPRYLHEVVKGVEGNIRRLHLQLFGTAFLSAVLLAFFAAPLATLLGNRTLIPIIQAAALDVVPFSLYVAAQAVFHGRNQYSLLVLGRIIYFTAKLLLMAGALLLFSRVDLMFVGMACASLITASVSWFLVLRTNTRRRFPSEDAPQACATPGFPASFVLTGSNGFLVEGDLLLVQACRLGDTIVGEYSGAKNIAKLLFFGFHAVTLPITPQIAYHGGFMAAYHSNKEMRKLVWIVLVGTATVSAACMFFSEELVLLIFGRSFTLASSFLYVLTPAIVLLLAALFRLGVLFHSGRSQAAGLMAFSGALLFAVLGFALGKSYGPNGVALSLALVSFSIAAFGSLVRKRSKN